MKPLFIAPIALLGLWLPACGEQPSTATSGGDARPDVVYAATDELVIGHLRVNSSSVFVTTVDLAGGVRRLVRVDRETRARKVLTERPLELSLGDVFVTDSEVFFTEREKSCSGCFANAGWIRRVSVDGGEVSTLTVLDSSAPHRLVAAGGYIWFTDVNRLRRISMGGWPPETLLSSAHDHELVASHTTVYFQGPGRIDGVPFAETAASELVPTDASLVALVAHGGFVYWASGYGEQSAIRRISESGGLTRVLATEVGVGVLLNFAVGPALFFTDWGKGVCAGQLVRVDLETSERAVWASELCQPLEVAVDVDDVFFLAKPGVDSQTGAILRVSASATPE